MEKNTICTNIRRLREARLWSQEEAALASGLDVRTIQRVEAGQAMSRETLKALAAAFDTTVEDLSVSQEEIQKQLEDFTGRYKMVRLNIIKNSGQLGELLSAADAFHVQQIGELTDPHLDQIAQFEEQLRDCLDVSDMGAVLRREMEKGLWLELETLISSGLSVSFGIENMGLRSDTVKPFRMSILYVAVAAGPIPLRTLVRPKNQQIAFA